MRHPAPVARPVGPRFAFGPAPGRPAVGAQPRREPVHYALALVILTYIWRFQDLVPVLTAIKFPTFCAISALVLFFTSAEAPRAVQVTRAPVLRMLLALLAIMVLGLPTSLYPGLGVKFLATDYIPNLLFAILIAATIRSVGDIEWFALVNLFGALVYALFIYFLAPLDSTGRFIGLAFYDANDLALVFICTLPFALYFLQAGTPALRRVLAVAGVMAFILVIIKGGSRGGFIALLVVMAYMALRYRAIPASRRLAAVVGSLLAMTILAGPAYWERMRTLLRPKEDYNWSGREVGGRMETWKRGVGYMLSNPFLGTGLRTFPRAEGTSALAREYQAANRGLRWQVAHNSFIEMGAELGVAALVLFVGLFVWSFRALSRIRPRGGPEPPPKSREAALAKAIVGSLIGFVVAGFFVSAQYFSFLYLMLGFIIGLTRLPSVAPALLRRPAAGPPAQWSGVGMRPPVHVRPPRG